MPTIRQQITGLLEQEALDARTLSSLLGVREKEIYPHLTHIRRTLQARGQTLVIAPYQCRLCGFTFKNRTKLHPPGRCPQCKLGSIKPAQFTIK
jgi:predicted Zn-ribbon and HTH transcriptional regulator